MYLAVLVGAAILYGLTCQRGVSWQDSGMFQFRAGGAPDLAGHLGLALAHPLYIIAGWALKFVPVGSFPWRLNFFSGLGMAVALANVAAVCAVLTGRRRIGAAVAAMLAVAHTPWWLATIAEVYTWSLAGFTAELWLLVALIRRPTWPKLLGLALLNGLGLSVHNFALLPLPVYVVAAGVLVRRRRLPAWSLAAAAGAYLLGAGLYVGMTAAEAVRTGQVTLAIKSALFGRYQSQVLGTAAPGRQALANFALVGLNFLNVLLPLAAVGAWVLKRRLGAALAWPLWALTLIHMLFAVRYFVPDQFTFFLPTCALAGVLAAVGLEALAARSRGWRRLAWAGWAVSIILMPLLYGLAPSAARRWAPSVVRRSRELPFRDEARYWLTPWKQGEDSAERFALAALKQVEPDAVIVAAPTPYYPLAVARRVEGLGAGVALCGGHEPWPLPKPARAEDADAFFRAVGDRPLYVVSPRKGYCPPGLLETATFDRAGVLYRLRRPRPVGPLARRRAANRTSPGTAGRKPNP